MTATTAKLVSLLKPKRTWLQFRLKAIFVLVVIVAVPFAWFKWKSDRKASERQAVAAIKNLHGQLRYEWEPDLGNELVTGPKKEQPGPAWLRKRLGDDFFSKVVVVSFKNAHSRVTDDWLVHLEHLPDLEKVYIGGKRITDAGVARLAGLRRLKWLDLATTGMTDNGLIHLKSLTKLERLDLRDTNVTDAGLVHVAGLRRLQNLKLDHTRVTDAGLPNLRGLSNLLVLWLPHTTVSEAGAAELQMALPNCKIIR